jgi:SpoVK/Ycf46/Vps4 family AAA+-type ATPase
VKAVQINKLAELQPFDTDLAYLEAELEWVAIRCKRIGAEGGLGRVGGGPSDTDKWAESKAVYRARIKGRVRELQANEKAIREVIDIRRGLNQEIGKPLALDKICQTYRLSLLERRAVLLSASAVFSTEFEAHFSTLMGERVNNAAPTVEILFRFSEFGFAERIQNRKVFSKGAPLSKNDLISMDLIDLYHSPEDLLEARISLNTMTLNFLLGEAALGDDFLEFSSMEEPLVTLDQVVLEEGQKDRMLSVVQSHDTYLARRKEWGFDERITYGRGILMLFHGEPGTGKTMTAHGIAHAMGKRILNVDIPTFIENRSAGRFLPGLFREARIQNALLFFDECETLFGDRRGGNILMTTLLTELERFEGVAILATNLPKSLDAALGRRILVKCKFTKPDCAARQAIWKGHMPPKAPFSEDVDVQALAADYELTGGLIKNAILMAVAEAVHQGGKEPEINMGQLRRAARAQMIRLEGQGSQVVQPKVRLADVILPRALKMGVEELIGSARNRRQVLERWGIGSHLSYGKGVAALFYGEPGTGKTLCAEAVASELNRPLIRAAVPTLVSKYVGNTERNLSALFQTAKAEGAVLLLDEADSLLMTRGQARASRHDNSSVNVLLQEIERFEGVVILATNLPEDLDKALARRLSCQLEFTLPGVSEREQIYALLLPETVPMDPCMNLRLLASRYTLSGGQIKNVVFRAAFRAASKDRNLRQADLEAAAIQELGGFVGGTRGRRAGF